MSTTISDIYDDTIEVEGRDGDGIYIDVNEGDETASVALDGEQTKALLAAIAKHAELEAPQPPAGAVRASDIPLNEALLRVAAAHHVPVRFRYAKGDGTLIETRMFTPSDVKDVGMHVTFTGYDPDRDDYSAYRSDRIKGQVQIV